MHFTMMHSRSNINSTAPQPVSTPLKQPPRVVDANGNGDQDHSPLGHDDDDDADSATTATTSITLASTTSSAHNNNNNNNDKSHHGREEDGAPQQLHCSKKSKIEEQENDESSESSSSSLKEEPEPPDNNNHKQYQDGGNSGSESKLTTKSKIKPNTKTPKLKPKTSSKPKPKAKPKHPSSYLPHYLRNYCEHSHGDFFISPFFDARLIAQLMYEGFLPIATSRFLVPKLHQRRSVIYPLDIRSASSSKSASANANANATFTNTCAVHISRSTKKKAKRFTFTVNSSFEKVVQGCHHQHGISWLYPSIVRAFRQLHAAHASATSTTTPAAASLSFSSTTPSNSTSSSSTSSAPISSSSSSTSTSAPASLNSEPFPIRLYSIEVYNAQTGKLAGGELGYAFGKIYTSLTGFAAEDSAGSVQLAALGTLLWSLGFDMWDMGMSLDYKAKLGAHEMERDDFVNKVKELRVQNVPGAGNSADGESIICNKPRNCRDILQQCKRDVE